MVLDLPPHLKSVASLPCKVECSTVQFYRLQHVIHCKCDAQSFIYSICLPEMLDSVSYVYTDKFVIVQRQHCVKNLFALCTQARWGHARQ